MIHISEDGTITHNPLIPAWMIKMEIRLLHLLWLQYAYFAGFSGEDVE